MPGGRNPWWPSYRLPTTACTPAAMTTLFINQHWGSWEDRLLTSIGQVILSTWLLSVSTEVDILQWVLIGDTKITYFMCTPGLFPRFLFLWLQVLFLLGLWFLSLSGPRSISGVVPQKMSTSLPQWAWSIWFFPLRVYQNLHRQYPYPTDTSASLDLLGHGKWACSET